jgi:flagellin
MGGRDQEMTFGIGRINYTDLYKTDANARTIVQAVTTGTAVDGPNKGATFNLAHLPSDAVVAKEYGRAAATAIAGAAGLEANKTYIVETAGSEDNTTAVGGDADAIDIQAKAKRADGTTAIATADTTIIVGFEVKVGAVAIADGGNHTFKEVSTDDNAFAAGDEFEIVSLGSSDGNTATGESDAKAISAGTSVAGGTLAIGQKFTVDAAITAEQLADLNALTQGMTFRRSSDTLTKDIEAMQGLVNTARVQAGSQYAALESAVNYTTDLTAQYELGYNTVNDVNFSMETAHLAKNQILQQAATAMLAQANQGQQGLLQLIS